MGEEMDAGGVDKSLEEEGGLENVEGLNAAVDDTTQEGA